MLAHLQARGMLRREAEPRDDLVHELFVSIAARIPCQDCGAIGTTVHEDWEDDWEKEVRCEGCNAVIPAERLEIFPQTTHCIQCQQRVEAGNDIHQEWEYCPYCGGLMSLKKSGGQGIARYRMSCSSCGKTL